LEKLVLRMNVLDLPPQEQTICVAMIILLTPTPLCYAHTWCSLLFKNVLDLDVETGVNVLEKKIVAVTGDGN